VSGFRNIDSLIVPGVAAGSLTVGQVVYAASTDADPLSDGNVVEWAAATAASAGTCPGRLGVVALSPDDTIIAGSAVRVRLLGLQEELAVAGSPAAGATVYLTDAGGLSTTPGTVSRSVGIVVDGSGPYAVFVDAGIVGAGGGGSITINTTAPITGGGTGTTFTLALTFGTTAATALEGSNDALYVKLAGAQTVTGVKTFDADVQLATSRKVLGSAELTLEATGATPIALRTNSAERARVGEGLMVGTTTDPGAGRLRVHTAASIGAGTPSAGALLDVNGVTGGLLLPRMTTTQRDALPADAWTLIANTTTNLFEFFNGFSWEPLGRSSSPLYIIGKAEYGPRKISPQFDSFDSAKTFAQAAGHTNAENPCGFLILPGVYEETIALEAGWFVFGLDGCAETTVVRRVFATFATDQTYGNPGLDVCGFSNLTVAHLGTGPAVIVEPSGDKDIVVCYVNRVNISGDGSDGEGALRVVSGSVESALVGQVDAVTCTDSAGYAVIEAQNATVRLSLGIGVGAWSGSAQVPLLRQSDGVTYLSPSTPNVTTGNGAFLLDDEAELVLFGGFNAITRPLSGENSLFRLEGASTLKLLGSHVFASGPNTAYLFNTTSTGDVQIGGHYSVIGATASAGYRVKSGVTINGYTAVHDEVLEVITGATTIVASTTLAIIIPTDTSPFTVTLPDPTEWSHGRRLCVKYTGPTFKQELTLARPSGKTIDYRSSNKTLAWNDAYELVAYADGWIIRSGYSDDWSGGGGGGGVTRIVIYAGNGGNGDVAVTGSQTRSAIGGYWDSSEHNLSGGGVAKLRMIILDGFLEAVDFGCYTPTATVLAATSSSGSGTIEVYEVDVTSAMSGLTDGDYFQAWIQSFSAQNLTKVLYYAEIVITPP